MSGGQRHEFDYVVSGSAESRALKQPSSSDYSACVYDMWALAQAHGNVAAKPPRALLLWSTCCGNKHIVLCPAMQALEKRRGGRGGSLECGLMLFHPGWPETGRKGSVRPDKI